MIQDTEKTNVQFYLATYDANESDEQPYKEVIAVFVDEILKGTDYLGCYAHLGQHSTCCQSFSAQKSKKQIYEIMNKIKANPITFLK